MPLNATQLAEQDGLIYQMASPDQLNIIAKLIPYLQLRKEVARDYLERPQDEKLLYIKKINQQIAQLLAIN